MNLFGFIKPYISAKPYYLVHLVLLVIGPLKGLDEALDLWQDLISGSEVPSLNSGEQTVFSLHLLGSLFRLMGKVNPSFLLFSVVSYCIVGSYDYFFTSHALFFIQGPKAK